MELVDSGLGEAVAVVDDAGLGEAGGSEGVDDDGMRGKAEVELGEGGAAAIAGEEGTGICERWAVCAILLQRERRGARRRGRESSEERGKSSSLSTPRRPRVSLTRITLTQVH